MSLLSEAIGIEPSPVPPALALPILKRGELEILGRLPWSSNATLLAKATLEADFVYAIYKPRRGERPLWDFPQGSLCQREVAAYQVSEALGWGLVPPTLLRKGPLGLGALQLFVDHDPDAHFLTLDAPDPDVVRRLVAFDVITNNADRKSGHVLQDPAGRLWAIDHGIAFHVEPKLRTVIWEHAGEVLPEDLCHDLGGLGVALADRSSEVRAALGRLLAAGELGAFERRVRSLVAAGRFPDVNPDRREIPWPPV